MKIKSEFLFAGTILLLLILACAKNEPEPIIGKAGRTTIPLSEFRERYELTPHILQTRNIDQNRRNVLISLLGEKVLAEEAYRRGWNKNDKFKAYSEQMKKEAIVEALFEKEVSSQIQITDEEMKQGFFRSQTELEIQVLSFQNMQQATEAKKQIDAGKSLNQVKREFQTDTFISADSVLTLKMKWGEAHPRLEDAAFRLQPNEVSDPVEADGLGFIIKLLQKQTTIFLTETDYVRQAPAIRKTIQQRKSAAMFTDFMRSLMTDKEVKVSHYMFDLVASELEKIYLVGDSLSRSANKQRFMESPLDSIQKKDFADHLADPFARFNDGSIWTVGDFIKKLSIGPYPLDYKSRESFRKSLSSQIRRMIEFESLAKKGQELGLQNSYYVRYQTKMWNDAYLAQQLHQETIDTIRISDDEVKQYYQAHQPNCAGTEMVKLQEILVDNETLARELYGRILNQEDMSQLARKYNQRALSRQADGVMGYFSTSALGKIGETARNLKVGEIGGPIKTETNQYSVFKVLDKKIAAPLPLAEVWDTVKRDALAEKKSRTIDARLIQLADKYPIRVNQTVLDTLKLTDVSMMVLKQHFPNRTAAPFVMPLNESHQWQKLMDDVLPSKK